MPRTDEHCRQDLFLFNDPGQRVVSRALSCKVKRILLSLYTSVFCRFCICILMLVQECFNTEVWQYIYLVCAFRVHISITSFTGSCSTYGMWSMHHMKPISAEKSLPGAPTRLCQHLPHISFDLRNRHLFCSLITTYRAATEHPRTQLTYQDVPTKP